MATYSNTLAWKIPWMEEPGGLRSMGSLQVGYNWATSLSLFTFMHWGRKWQPTPVFLPGESQGRRSLVRCSPWGCTELDTTEVTYQQQQQLHSLIWRQWVVFFRFFFQLEWYCVRVEFPVVYRRAFLLSMPGIWVCMSTATSQFVWNPTRFILCSPWI